MKTRRAIRIRWSWTEPYDLAERVFVAFRDHRPWFLFRATPSQLRTWRAGAKFVIVRHENIVEWLDRD